MKFITLITAAKGQDPRQFQNWYLKEHAPLVLEHAGRIGRYIVNLVDVAPPEVEGTVAIGQATSPVHNVITEMWLDSPEDFKDRTRLYGSASAADTVDKHLGSRVAQSFAYRVTEIVEKDRLIVRLGERSPGLKNIIPINWLPGLSVDQGRMGWQVHGPLALRTHTGMSKYVRNLVEEVLTPGAPAYPGIGELHFATADDMKYGTFPRPGDLEIIAFDTARWLGVTCQHYCSEYVLKA